jgi:hypothetical protein
MPGMSWVTDRLAKQGVKVKPRQRRFLWERPPSVFEALDGIGEALAYDLAEFKDGTGAAIRLSRERDSIQVGPLLGTAILAWLKLDLQRGAIVFGSLAPQRKGRFVIRDIRICQLGSFSGEPQPQKDMTPEKFSQFILEPILFPQALDSPIA